jgi:hypothetical protein
LQAGQCQSGNSELASLGLKSQSLQGYQIKESK